MNGKARVGQQGRAAILVVEDEVLIRIAVAERLREAGYIVVEAATAEDAMRFLNAGQVSLVFVEANLPGDIDGNALAAWIEATCPEVRVLMTSAHQAEAFGGRDRAR